MIWAWFNISDHHTSWQILEIFLYAMSAELILPYARQVLADNLEPSVRGFLEHLRTPYQKLLYIIFKFGLAFLVFRTGVRRNNSEVILASRSKFSPLFFGFIMPFTWKHMTRMQCPSVVYEFIANHESYSVSGNKSNGEGRYCVLENLTRTSKRVICSRDCHLKKGRKSSTEIWIYWIR